MTSKPLQHHRNKASNIDRSDVIATNLFTVNDCYDIRAFVGPMPCEMFKGSQYDMFGYRDQKCRNQQSKIQLASNRIIRRACRQPQPRLYRYAGA